MKYALEGSIYVGGSVVQWLRDGLGFIKSSGEIEELASSVPDSGGVYFVPALTGLAAPYWDQYARGTIVGITRGTTRAHIARAALDGIAFQTYDIAQAMAKDMNAPLTELKVDGGASTAVLPATTCSCSSRPTSSASLWYVRRSRRRQLSVPLISQVWP